MSCLNSFADDRDGPFREHFLLFILGYRTTAYLNNRGTLEHAQRIAAHSSARTTKLYDRTGDAVSLDEIEKIVI